MHFIFFGSAIRFHNHHAKRHFISCRCFDKSIAVYAIVLSCRVLPEKKDTSNYLAEARNRDVIPEHKNAIKNAKMVNGPGNSQPVYAFAKASTMREAMHQAREAAAGRLSPQGVPYKFTICGGNHSYHSSADGATELELEGRHEEAAALRRIPCYILCWPDEDDKTPEGRQKIVTTIREVRYASGLEVTSIVIVRTAVRHRTC